MNGLSLRITSGLKKSKNNMSLPPVVISNFAANGAGPVCAMIELFLRATSADEQLGILKKLLESDPIELNVMNLLVIVFFHSDAKHPVKCFLTRHITKNKHLQESFIELLTSELTTHLKHGFSISNRDAYKTCKEVVSKVGMCIENFPAGMHAVKNVEKELALYLGLCLDCCIHTLSIYNSNPPSPTEKNVIYSLAHLTLRLMLHIITKNQSESDKEDSRSHVELVKTMKFKNLQTINKLLEDRDVPMDTKSVCGILVLSLDAYSFNPPYLDSWKTFLNPSNKVAISDDQVQLALYSAIITTVPIHRLDDKLELDDSADIAAIIFILQKFMEIVERNSSDGVLILGVSRALHALSKGLPRLEVSRGVQASEQLLRFVWSHLEHYMDSVRHLAAQTLACIVQYCAHLEITGQQGSALSLVVEALLSLGVCSRGFLVGLGALSRTVGAGRVLRDVAPLSLLLPALAVDHVAATATATLEALLVQHSQETEAAVIHETWVLPIIDFVQTNDLESEVLIILENLLAKAVKLDKKLLDYILPHIKQACASPRRDLNNVLVLLSVARASLTDTRVGDVTSENLWRGIISYDVLEDAIVDANDEIRLQCLSLCSGAGAGGGRVARGEGALVLRYLRYNMSAQAPHCRQLAVSMLKKFIKRVFDGYRAANRSGDVEQCRMCREFIEELRRLCYASLQPGGNYSRRSTALQLLQCCEPAVLPALERTWRHGDVDKLLQHLDDSYETNKVLALDILLHVPLELIKDVKHSVSLQLKDIIRQANALKPTECVSAAYKLELLWRRLPDSILQGNTCDAKDPALFTLVSELKMAAEARHPCWMGLYDPILAPRDRPTYGPLYCIAHLVDRMDPDAIADDRKWMQLFDRIIITCQNMLEATGAVVNHAAPEGVMPPDAQYSDYGNNAGVALADGRQITAQMVLLCAWRTFKEATSVLGALGSRLAVPGSLGPGALHQIAETLAAALGSARHRGAFEQAYVAYQRVLNRMWSDTRDDVRGWVKLKLKDTLAGLRAGEWTQAADRRSAGLPFLIQALVSTEVGAGGAGAGLRDVMQELLRRAETGEGEQRAHACNVLRALYRDSSLDTAVQGYVGEGLRVALKGFEGASWAERNSSTLLLSALMTRVFGVTRARHTHALSARNRMTGRVFFLRYPALYDIMLNKLKEASESENKRLLCPSLYPVLLLLARLYPSSLEGTESNLKLVSFVPLVVRCARARVLLARRLAADAGVALVAPDRYVSHVTQLLGEISQPHVEMNYCHGILLQLCALLDNKPAGVDCRALSAPLACSGWIARARRDVPACYPVLHHYVRLLHTLLTRFPEVLENEFLEEIEAQVADTVFHSRPSAVSCGRDACLPAGLRLLVALRARAGRHEEIADLVMSALVHSEPVVCDAALDCVLEMHGRPVAADLGGSAQTGGSAQAGASIVLSSLRSRAEYLAALVRALRPESVWRRSPQRALRLLEVLVAEGGTEELVECVPPRPASRPWCRPRAGDHVISSLVTLVKNGPDYTTHLYLEALTRCLSERLEDPESAAWICDGVETVRLQCGPGAELPCRQVAATFLKTHARALLDRSSTMPDFSALRLERSVLVGTAWLLQDEEGSVRAQASLTVQALARQESRAVVPSVAGSLLLDLCERRPGAAGLLVTLALSDPPHRSPLPDARITDECRVFEPNEKYNVHGEEVLWAVACAEKVVGVCARAGVDPLEHVTGLIRTQTGLPWYTCEAFERAARGDETAQDQRMEAFVRILKTQASK